MSHEKKQKKRNEHGEVRHKHPCPIKLTFRGESSRPCKPQCTAQACPGFRKAPLLNSFSFLSSFGDNGDPGQVPSPPFISTTPLFFHTLDVFPGLHQFSQRGATFVFGSRATLLGGSFQLFCLWLYCLLQPAFLTTLSQLPTALQFLSAALEGEMGPDRKSQEEFCKPVMNLEGHSV